MTSIRLHICIYYVYIYIYMYINTCLSLCLSLSLSLSLYLSRYVCGMCTKSMYSAWALGFRGLSASQLQTRNSQKRSQDIVYYQGNGGFGCLFVGFHEIRDSSVRLVM